ncbi:MAG: malonyl-CoA decarboxylase family protein [Pseudomonadota bacterium]
MSQWSFLGDLLTSVLERSRSASSAHDDRSIQEMCYALLDTEGEIAGITLAQAILDRYAALDAEGKRAFFAFLNEGLEIDFDALDGAIKAFKTSQAVPDYRTMVIAAEPRRQELLRRLNQPPGATHALVKMRADLLRAVKDLPDLGRTDQDFRHLLRSWFNRGFLILRQINWDTPASILEKIVAYEAVHAIQDWDDLRRRLYPQDRRCFAFFHPSMPDEPLIFVEVALTETVPSSIQRVLSDTREQRVLKDTKVAVFYSISNCQAGLGSISFGNLLIKQVVAELRQELPGLDTFVTLSPIPKLTAWLRDTHSGPDAADLLKGKADPDTVRMVAADYLLNAKRSDGAPFDPVARFHLGNGAQIYAVHGAADMSKNGMAQSLGTMVNYQYDLAVIEQNHIKFVRDGEVAKSPNFRV